MKIFLLVSTLATVLWSGATVAHTCYHHRILHHQNEFKSQEYHSNYDAAQGDPRYGQAPSGTYDVMPSPVSDQ